MRRTYTHYGSWKKAISNDTLNDYIKKVILGSLLKKYNKRLLLRAAVTALACASVTSTVFAAKQDQKTLLLMTTAANVKTPAVSTNPGHIWNLENADIRSVINEVSKETGKNFVIDPRVSGQVSLVSTTPLPPDALYSVFLTMLEVYGFSAIPNNHIIQIIPDLTAPQFSPPLVSNDKTATGNEVVIRVIPVKYISSTQLVPILRPLMPQWSVLSAYPPSNLIIASGGAVNVDRIEKIINRIDVVSNNDVSIIPLKNANTEQIVKILKDLQSSTQINGGSTATVAIDADDRTNSVILSGNETERLRLSVIITQLDAPSSTDRGHTQVIFLSYLNAKKLALILDKIAKAQGNPNSSNNSAGNTSGPGYNSMTGGGNSSKDTSSDISNLTSVLPEEDDNALIINASESLMQNLKAIIQQLDIRPEQVFIQAIIVELDSSSMEKLGVQWGTFMTSGTTNTVSTSGGIITTNSGGGLSGDFAGGNGVGVIQNGHFAALAAAIKGLSGADILSEPSLMIQNNTKAVFKVGQQVPVQSSEQGSLNSGSNAEGVPNTLISFNQQDVGLNLTVTPQINRDNSVQLLIDQTNGSLQNPENPTTTPIINKSEIKTSVLINSGDILILGGLMSNNMTTSTYKTPILGDIPIIGNLFSYTSHQLEKKDLIVFLKPVIVSTPLDGTNITDEKYKYVRNLQLHWTYDNAKEDTPNSRLLPPRELNLPLPLPFDEKE